jgi:hypothetical protein
VQKQDISMFRHRARAGGCQLRSGGELVGRLTCVELSLGRRIQEHVALIRRITRSDRPRQPSTQSSCQRHPRAAGPETHFDCDPVHDLRFGVLSMVSDNERQRNRLTQGLSDHGQATSVRQGGKPMMKIKQLRLTAAHARVAQPHR